MTFAEDCQELGEANRDVTEAYIAVLNFKEAYAVSYEGIGNTPELR